MDQVKQRFESKIFHSPDGCWYWTSTQSKNGYGSFFLNNTQISAHRISYILHKGDIPDKLQVLHNCDNTLCVNPDHLFLGTPKDNMDDKIRKGRDRYNHKLSKEEVIEIRRLVASGVKQRVVARQFNTCFQNISMIITGRNRARD